MYATDILLIVLFILFMLNSGRSFLKKFSNAYIFFAACAVLLTGIIFSKTPQAGMYIFAKFLEVSFFAYYIAKAVDKKNFQNVCLVFSLGVVLSSLLAVAQFFHQGSIGSIFYFFGERTFTGSTPGIANANINGGLVLRPYATFPHPNVLAGYLTIAMAMVVSNFKIQISKFKKIFFAASIIFGTVALLLSFSRVAILLWFIFLFLFLLQKTKLRIKNIFLIFIVAACVIVLFFLSPLHYRFAFSFSDEPVVQREQLANAALAMIKTHLFFGVGLGNFLINLPQVLKTSSVSLLQPVHNIYLLILSETGIAGFAVSGWFVFATYKKIKTSPPLISNPKFILLSLVLIIGFFDHYFLTLQQGQLLLGLIIGLCYCKAFQT